MNNRTITIALDAMGGDGAPAIVVYGAKEALKRNPNLKFHFYGQQASVEPLLCEAGLHDDERCTLIACTDVVKNDDKPSNILRSGTKTSMAQAIRGVHEKQSDCVVSAGNTGALMALSMFTHSRIPGVLRPAIATYFPTIRGESCILDLGANVECDAQQLAQFAVMGEVFGSITLGLDRPSVGILNVGTESIKGHPEVRAARDILQAAEVLHDFRGFVEGTDISEGKIDVFVTDGFTGNLILKSAEGTAKLIAHYLREALANSLGGKLLYLLGRKRLLQFRARVDPRNYNGAVFLGLNGISVKSHGSADARAFANAIDVAADLTQYDLVSKIGERIGMLREAINSDKTMSAK
ncbi:MAG: phosphate acyltransferase PlsX [Pseudomonadota bacterium]